jgi:hypothetical protein
MRRALRWVKRIFLGLLALVLVVVITVLIVLHTDWGRDKARRIVLENIQQFFPGGIHVDKIEGSVLGDIELVGVTINGFDKKQMLRAGRVKTNVRLSALFTKTIALEYATVDDVEVWDPSNPVKIKEDPEPGTWTVEMPNIEVRKARVSMSGAQPITLEQVEVDAVLNVVPPGSITAKAVVRGHWKERDLPLIVDAEASVGETIEVPKLVVTLGDTRVEATKVLVDLERPVASLKIHATPAVVAKFAPDVKLPAPADIALEISAVGSESRVELDATMGKTTLRGAFLGVIATQKVRGMLTASGVDLHMFIPRLTGYGDGTLAIVGDGKALTGHVLVLTRGQLLDLPAGHAMVDLDANAKGAHGFVIAGGKGEVGMAAIGQLIRESDPAGDRYTLAGARVNVTAKNAAEATGGQVPVKGSVYVSGTAHGTIAPKLALEATGVVRGRRLVTSDPKMGGIAIAEVDGTGEALLTEEGTLSHLHATLKNVSRAGAPLGTFEVDARNRRDGKIVAHLQARPAAIPGSTGALDAVVTLAKRDGDPLRIELGEHSFKANRLVWGGKGGTIVVTDDQVEVHGVRSTSGKSSIAVDATVVKATQALEVKVEAKDIAAQMIDPTYLGTASASIDMNRRGVRWDGKANIKVNGVALGPNQPAIEGAVAVTIEGRHVKADVTANTFQVGGVRLVLDVDGPADITDVNGWRGLERKAIRAALLGVSRIDLAAAKIKTGGIIDGELVLSGMETSGTFKIAGVQTPVGVVKGEINFAPMGNDLGVSSTVHVENFGDAQIGAQIAIPPHPFEPTEWKKLGRGVVRLLTANIENLEINPTKLARLGIVQPYSARANINVALAAGTGDARLTVDIKDIRGGKLLKPIDVHLEGAIDANNTTALVAISTGKSTLTTVTAKLPAFGFDRWLSEAPLVKDAPLVGKLEIPNIDVVETLGIFGRIDITSGKLGGVINFAGTPMKPTADAELVVSNVNVKPRLAGRKLPTLTELKITGKWDGAEGQVLIAGKESDGATLDISARARADNLAAVQAKVDIRKFDIAPVAVFLPGPLVAATGKIGAKITVTGLSVDKVRGTLAIEKARVPIHPQVGTVRDANVSVKLTDLGLAYNIEAKLGAGTIKLKGDAGKDLSRIKLEGSVEKLSPIGQIQPVVSTTISGTIFREAGLMRADVTLSKASVSLDMEQGVELLASEMPDDLFLGRSTAPPPTPKQLRIPRKPWISVKVRLESTPIFVKHEYFVVRARASSPRGLTLSIGRTFGMDGSIEIERGDVDVLGRQYRVDPGPDKIRFDGTVDPLLAVRLVHEFPELTLTADLVGRASKKEIRMSGTPALFTQDQLFAFFLGGDPSGDAGSQTRDAASSVGAAVLSAKVARQAKKVLPFRIDTFNCDPGTSASGSNCKFGRWLTANWFVAYKQRIEPRPDESPQEVQLQYYFRKNWLLEGAGFTERFGGDILWRKRW